MANPKETHDEVTKESAKRPRDEVTEEPAKRLRLREPSIFNVRPSDDIVNAIADYIAEKVSEAGRQYAIEDIEIEAKLGVLIDKETMQRIRFDVTTETIIMSHEMRRYRFESNMPKEQHQHFNKVLNDLVTKSLAPEHKGERIKYKHKYEVDKFYGSCRATTDTKTGKIVPNGVIDKKRLSDLNIHAPRGLFDYRISINVERPLTEKDIPSTRPKFEREKDRLSYEHGGFAFDLTQVRDTEKDTDYRHELELEFKDTPQLVAEMKKKRDKEVSQYIPLVESFVNNIRMLCLRAKKM